MSSIENFGAFAIAKKVEAILESENPRDALIALGVATGQFAFMIDPSDGGASRVIDAIAHDAKIAADELKGPRQ